MSVAFSQWFTDTVVMLKNIFQSDLPVRETKKRSKKKMFYVINVTLMNHI